MHGAVVRQDAVEADAVVTHHALPRGPRSPAASASWVKALEFKLSGIGLRAGSAASDHAFILLPGARCARSRYELWPDVGLY